MEMTGKYLLKNGDFVWLSHLFSVT